VSASPEAEAESTKRWEHKM